MDNDIQQIIELLKSSIEVEDWMLVSEAITLLSSYEIDNFSTFDDEDDYTDLSSNMR